MSQTMRVEPGEILSDELASDVRLAMHVLGLTQNAVTEDRPLSIAVFNRMLLSKERLRAPYAEVMNDLLDQAAPHLLNRAKRFADRAARSSAPPLRVSKPAAAPDRVPSGVAA